MDLYMKTIHVVFNEMMKTSSMTIKLNRTTHHGYISNVICVRHFKYDFRPTYQSVGPALILWCILGSSVTVVRRSDGNRRMHSIARYIYIHYYIPSQGQVVASHLIWSSIVATFKVGRSYPSRLATCMGACIVCTPTFSVYLVPSSCTWSDWNINFNAKQLKIGELVWCMLWKVVNP